MNGMTQDRPDAESAAEMIAGIKTGADLAAVLSECIPMGADSRRLGEVIRRENLWGEAMDFALQGGTSGPGAHLAFRGAWALEHAYFADREAFRPYIKRFLDDFTQIRNPSVHRHYTKMLLDMMRRGTVRLEGGRADRIAEFCFDRLIDPRTKVAVKAWAMDVLVLLASQVDWVGEYLPETIRHQMDGASPGMQNHGRKLLKRLR